MQKMEVNKLINSINDAVSEVFDGSTIMIGGFGEAGSPVELIHSLIDNGSKNLTIIANNAGNNIDTGSSITAYVFEHDCIASFRFATNSQTLGAKVEALKITGKVI